MSSLLMHVHPWDLPRPLYHSLSWCHPCIAPMAFLFIPFSTHHAVPREEARGRSSSAAACSTSCLVFFLVVVVLVTGSENATLATVMVCRCFNRFPIWSVWASHTLSKLHPSGTGSQENICVLPGVLLCHVNQLEKCSLCSDCGQK